MTTLCHCRIVDVRQGLIKEGSVTVEGDKIISADNHRVLDTDSIDIEGGYLLPGLINCHVHLGEVFPSSRNDPNEGSAIQVLRCLRRGMDALQAGITTVRSEGTRYGADIDLRTMIRRNWVEGPRIVSCRQSIQVTGGHGSEFGAVSADGPEDFLKKARSELFAGADHLKIFITGGIARRLEAFDHSQMTAEEIEAVVTAARGRNTYVSAHSGSPGPILEAVKAGVRSFEHGYIFDREAARSLRESASYLCPTLFVTRCSDWMQKNRFESWLI